MSGGARLGEYTRPGCNTRVIYIPLICWLTIPFFFFFFFHSVSNVQVTLQILTALIEKVPRDLPLYASSVLTIIDTVLRSYDISMVEESIHTFETFCRHQDMAALAAHADQTNQFHEIVRTYTAFATPDPTFPSKVPLTPPMVIRWRNAGLQAIKSVVSSEGMGADGGKLLDIIVPVILQNLYSGGEDVLVSLQMKAQASEKQEWEQARRRRMSVGTVQTVETTPDGNAAEASGSTADADKAAEVEVRVLALRCLERIFAAGSNRGQIRMATSLVLQFIMSRNPKRSSQGQVEAGGNWATSLMELIAKWAPVQDRFIILVTAMETLLDTPTVEDKLEQQLSLVSMIDWLLKSSINMIGLSIMDVLLGLVHQILLLLQLHPPNFNTQPSARSSPAHQIEEQKETAEEAAVEAKPDLQPSGTDLTAPPSPARRELLALLQQCIGNLATHIYYADQIADMIKTILARLKTPIASDVSAIENPSEAATAAANAAQLQQDQNTHAFFSFATARVTALKAIKDILIVANTKNPIAAAGVESRNRVGMQAWEGTQWLLRDPDREVRHAYVDALLSWLKFETNKSDLRVQGDTRKVSRTLARREAADVTEKPSKRVVSAASQREKASAAARSNFLQLLHLAIYDNAIESPTVESDVLLLHLLLVNLVEKLGVNAARHGLPMILRLQEDLATVESLSSFSARVNVGSLVHGYLWALSEKFAFEASPVGRGIHGEILKRQKAGAWFEMIRLPPIPLDHIVPSANSKVIAQSVEAPDAFVPFAAVDELVRQIETAYNTTSSMSPAQSPATSPGRGFSLPSLGQGHAAAPGANPGQEDVLPSEIMEQMLSRWSKEACLAAVEEENARAVSLSGSRTWTFGARSYPQQNGAGNGSPTGTGSPTSASRRPASGPYGLGGAGGLLKQRRTSMPEGSRTPVTTSSSKESTVRMDELKRVLSVTNTGNVRHSSPLRGRLDTSSSSVVTSSSESMISGAFSTSDAGASDRGLPSRAQSFKEGSETPRASAAYLTGDENNKLGQPFDPDDDIPPVPPLPADLIPGGLPPTSRSGSSRSSSYGSGLDRPSTAPAGSRGSVKSRPNTAQSPYQGRSMNRQKTRSSTGLANAAAAGKKRASSIASSVYSRDIDAVSEFGSAGSTTSAGPRTNVELLLDGIDGILHLEPEEDGAVGHLGPTPGSTPAVNGRLTSSHSAETRSLFGSRRKSIGGKSIGARSIGGIGRPPY